MSDDIEKNHQDAIIRADSLYRKKDRTRTGYKFVSEYRFKQLTAEISKRGAIILRGGDEVEEYLDKRMADALTVNDILFFRQQVTLSEVLEEVFHFEQNLRKANDDKHAVLRVILNEIEAKKYLLSNAAKYKIPRKETTETKEQLQYYEEMLKKWEERHHV